MRAIIRIIAVAGASLALVAPARAQSNDGGRVIVASWEAPSGRCHYTIATGYSAACKGVLYLQFENGGVSFNVGSGKNVVSFYGTRDRKTGDRYHLTVSKVYVGVGRQVLNDSSIDGQAEIGQCDAVFSPDMHTAYRIQCSVPYPIFSSASLNFEGPSTAYNVSSNARPH